MEVKQTREAVITNEVLTPEDQKRIEDFLKPYASKLKIDWKKDNTISIRTKHKNDGCNILIKYKDIQVKDMDVSQMNLFSQNGAEKSGKEVSDKGKILDMD